MEELCKQIREGRFTLDGYRLILESGVQIWVANGMHSYHFEPLTGVYFSFWEKLKLRSAIKEGMLLKILPRIKKVMEDE